MGSGDQGSNSFLCGSVKNLCSPGQEVLSTK